MQKIEDKLDWREVYITTKEVMKTLGIRIDHNKKATDDNIFESILHQVKQKRVKLLQNQWASTEVLQIELDLETTPERIKAIIKNYNPTLSDIQVKMLMAKKSLYSVQLFANVAKNIGNKFPSSSLRFDNSVL